MSTLKNKLLELRLQDDLFIRKSAVSGRSETTFRVDYTYDDLSPHGGPVKLTKDVRGIGNLIQRLTDFNTSSGKHIITHIKEVVIKETFHVTSIDDLLTRIKEDKNEFAITSQKVKVRLLKKQLEEAERKLEEIK